MKRFFKILGIIVLLLVAYVVIAMLAFSKEYSCERSIEINASPDQVWSHINSMEKINEWNPWMKLDPAMKRTYTGNSGSIGDKFCWDSTSDDAGKGCQEITSLGYYGNSNGFVSSVIKFERPFEGLAFSDIKIEKKSNATKVIWRMKTEMATFMLPMKPFMDGQMKKSYDEGLQSLKQISEK